MTRFFRLTAFAALACALSACSQTAMTPTYKTIAPEEAQKMMDAEPDALILDVREPIEYDRGRIPGADNLPLSVLEKGIPVDFKAAKDATILVYCRSGRRSKLAADILVKAGYTKVYDFGGIESWPYRMTR